MIVIGVAHTAGFIRVVRGTMLDELRRPYVVGGLSNPKGSKRVPVPGVTMGKVAERGFISRDGHKLVDGGLVDNVPIQEVRERCKADIVIAVNVGSPMMKGSVRG